MAHVRLSSEFFVKERDQTYACWQIAIWRELFQNSIDAGAREIRINLKSDGAKSRLSFSDNGPGMSREVLENVYFAVGATTKTGAGQIGGMGRARILTCFSMEEYHIRSHNYEVIGHGGEYEVVDCLDNHHGCSLTIIVDCYETTLRTNLNNFLNESSINAKIYIDDVLYVKTENNDKFIKDLKTDGGVSFAKVYIDKSITSYVSLIRVNGVSMYSTYTGGDHRIIIELNPAMSRDILTSNRDGLRDEYSKVFHKFIEEMMVDVKSALKPKIERKVRNRTNTPYLRVGDKKEIGLEYVQKPSIERWLDNAQKTSFERWLDNAFGDIYVLEETTNPNFQRVAPNYYVENWNTVNGKSFRKGGNIIKNLLMWKTAISYALEMLVKEQFNPGFSFSTGFIFSDHALATYQATPQGHLFLFCPVDVNGKMKFSVTDKASLKKLMSMAKHEVTHIYETYHNERFSTMREQIDMIFDEGECFRRMKEALVLMSHHLRNIDKVDYYRIAA